MTAARLLLDEHRGRVFECVLRKRGADVERANDRLGERTTHHELLHWCDGDDAVLRTINAKDFEPLHGEVTHAAPFFLFSDQRLPDENSEGVAGILDVVINEYRADGVTKELVALDGRDRWVH